MATSPAAFRATNDDFTYLRAEQSPVGAKKGVLEGLGQSEYPIPQVGVIRKKKRKKKHLRNLCIKISATPSLAQTLLCHQATQAQTHFPEPPPHNTSTPSLPPQATIHSPQHPPLSPPNPRNSPLIRKPSPKPLPKKSASLLRPLHPGPLRPGQKTPPYPNHTPRTTSTPNTNPSMSNRPNPRPPNVRNSIQPPHPAPTTQQKKPEPSNLP